MFDQNLPDHFIQVPGGVGEQNGQLLQGDQIIKVNQTDLSNSTQVNCYILAIPQRVPLLQAFVSDHC